MPIYEFRCPECGHKAETYFPRPTDASFPCPECGETTERLYSLYSAKVFEVFETRHIMEDGSPVTVRGSGQLRQLERDHGVRLADKDARPPQTEFPKIGLGKPATHLKQD